MLVGGSQSRGVWGLKSTNVPGPKNSGTGKMIHFLDWFLVPFFSGIWMSIFRGGIWIFIILKKFITILDGSDSLELNWGYRQSLGIDDRRQWSIYPVGICFSLTSKTFVGSSHEVCINLRWSEMIHQRWFQMWSSVQTHTYTYILVGGWSSFGWLLRLRRPSIGHTTCPRWWIPMSSPSHRWDANSMTWMPCRRLSHDKIEGEYLQVDSNILVHFGVVCAG